MELKQLTEHTHCDSWLEFYSFLVSVEKQDAEIVTINTPSGNIRLMVSEVKEKAFKEVYARLPTEQDVSRAKYDSLGYNHDKMIAFFDKLPKK